MKKSLSTFLLLTSATLPFLAKIVVVILGFQGYLLQSLYKVFQLFIPCIWRVGQGKRGVNIFWPVAEPLPTRRVMVLGTVAALALSCSGIIALILLLPILSIDPQEIRVGFDARFSVGPMGAIAVVLFLSCLNSALEELHFRAWLDPELSKRCGSICGIGISAVAFASMHSMIFLGLPGIPPLMIFLAVIGLTVCGICWSLLARMRGGIHAAWWSHSLTDALLLGWGLFWLGYL